MSKKYEFSDYDKNCSLKLSLGIWLVIFYFLRPFILMLTSIQMGRGTRNAGVSVLKDMIYPDDFGLFIAILAALPVILIIIAYIKRQPEASQRIRKLWNNGAKFLVAAAVLNIIILFVPMIRGQVHFLTPPDWVQLAIAVGIIIFLSTSQRVKDTFADFPSE